MVSKFPSVDSIEKFLNTLDTAPYPFYQPGTESLLLDALAGLKTLQANTDCEERLMYRLQYHLVRLEEMAVTK